MMIVTELWFPAGCFIVIVGTFLGIQVTVWNSVRTFFGASQKLAQIIVFATLTATIALVVTLLTLDLNLAFLEGVLFFLF